MIRILAQNEKDTIGVSAAVTDLRRVIHETRPTFGVLNEWDRGRDMSTRFALSKSAYHFHRPPKGGGPILWFGTRQLLRIKNSRLALPELVGHLPGRRTRLGTSWLSEAFYADRTVILGFHMTAEVQKGKGYRTDWKHRLRVARHKRERTRLEKRANALEARGWTVYAAGDGNYDGMQIAGFRNCWDGYPGGDLQGRAVTVVYAKEKPTRAPETIRTRSDHLAVVVTYP